MTGSSAGKLQHAGQPSHGDVSGYRIDIQGLRALAVLLVILFHARLPVEGGFMGVDVFFVISGFVITKKLLDILAQGQPYSLRNFYLARMRRLLPPLALLSTVTAVFAMFLSPVGSQEISAKTGLFATLFTANAYLYRNSPGYFSPGADFNAMLHTWSLSVEEQFYFVFPLLLLAAWKLGKRNLPVEQQWLYPLRLVAILLFTSLSLCLYLSYTTDSVPGVSAPLRFAFYASPTRAWEFAAGALLAFPFIASRAWATGSRTWIGVIGALMVVGSAFWVNHDAVFPGAVAAIPVLGTMLLIFAGSSGSSMVNRLLAKPVGVWIGNRSYGWYLWHWPFVVFARASFPDSVLALVVASGLSLVPAALSYQYLELPIKRLSDRKTLWLTFGCMALPLAAFWALIQAHNGLTKSGNSAELTKALALHADAARECDAMKVIQQPEGSPCTWPSPGKKGSIWLVGDSNAGHFTEGVVAAGNAAGYEVTVATVPACPFVDLQAVSQGKTDARCQVFVQEALKALETRRPNLVILASASDGYIEEHTTSLRASSTDVLQTEAAGKADVWTTGVDRVLKRLTPGSPVVVVHPVPRFRTWTLGGCPAYRVMMAPEQCGQTGDRGAIEAWRARAIASEKAAIANNPGSSGADFAHLFCNEKECSVTKEKTFHFRDGAHLSIDGSLYVTSQMSELIAKTARQN